jgi:hypothetical protein
MAKRVLPVLLMLAGIAAAGVRVANPDLLKELSAPEQAVLAKQGMVARTTDADQMYDIYNDAADKKLPILVTTDPMLHVFHILYDYSLRTAELDHFYPAMERVLGSLLEYELAQYAQTREPVVKQALLENVAYLAVPLSYLRLDFEAPKPVAGLVQAERALIDANSPAKSAVMGYDEDFTQYKPRGHYTRNESFRRYFRAMMYIGRMTYRLPFARDTVLGIRLTRRAVLLAEAMEGAVADSGPSPKELWRRVYETTTYLVGSSDDILPDQYYTLARRLAGNVPLAAWVAPDSNVLQFCRAAATELTQPRILSDTVATAGIPAGMRLMGQRYIPDSHIFHNLTYSRLPNRFMPMGLDVMAVLGSDRAREYLVNLYHQDRYDGYLAKLDSMRAVFAAFDTTQWNQNAYYGWLHVLKLNLEPVKATSRKSLLATFVRSAVYPDKTLVSTCGSWTQLRHDTILYAKQSYTQGISVERVVERPVDVAYVEPKREVFLRVARLGSELQGRLKGFGALNGEVDKKLTDFISAAARLAAIVDGELAGTRMSPDDAGFCKGIGGLQSRLTTFGQSFGERYLSEAIAPQETVAVVPEKPSWTDRESGKMSAVQAVAKKREFVGSTLNADKKMSLVADVHTDPNSGSVQEEAVGNPCKVYAVIPFYGKQYLAVGACFSYYEFTKPMSGRMTDEEWQALSPKPPMPVWTKSFIVAP